MFDTVSRARRRPPSVLVMAAVCLVIFGAIAVLVAVRGSGSGPSPAVSDVERLAQDQSAIAAYSDAVAPATHEAGTAIVLGIRPDIEDFRNGRISVTVWSTDMLSRAQQFAEAWRGFAMQPVPRAMGDAGRSFDEAFGDYLLATTALYEAGQVEGPDRASLIALGAGIGDAGDHAFDQGAARLQAARQAAGLTIDSRFPLPRTTP